MHFLKLFDWQLVAIGYHLANEVFYIATQLLECSYILYKVRSTVYANTINSCMLHGNDDQYGNNIRMYV